MADNVARSPVILDRTALISRVDGDETLLAELVNLFLASCPELLAEVRDSVRRGNASQVRAAAHALRGAVANFSEGLAYEAARRLEEMGRDANLAEAPAAIHALELGIEQLRRELDGYAGHPPDLKDPEGAVPLARP